MLEMGGTAFKDWRSLYCNEMEDIWQSERTELRKIVMLLHALKQEFNRTENEVNNRLVGLRDKLKASDNQINDNGDQISNCENNQDSQSQKSPKLNRTLKKARLKHITGSPSLLHISKENKNESPERIKRQLFSPFLIESSPESKTRMPKFKNSIQLNKKPSHMDIVDSSMVEDIPVRPAPEKKKSKTNSKCTKSTTDEDIPLFTNFIKSETKASHTSVKPLQNKKKRKVGILTEHNVESGTSSSTNDYNPSDDETMIDCKSNLIDAKAYKFTTIQKDLPTTTFFEDYDRLPQQDTKSPKHVYKTEPVRKKTERMKLPGWSCADCEKFYKGMDLTPEELQQKMNACSKHRNKFPLLNETPKGFWDITMQLTQKPPEEDSFVFEI